MALALAAALAGSTCALSRDPESAEAALPIPRLAILAGPRASREFEEKPTPLVFGGGFLNKTLAFETLTRADRAGHPLPGLAESWSTPDRGLTWLVELRRGARFHDGTACDAGAVREHFLRWLGADEAAFIPAAVRIESVETRGATTLVFRLRAPLALPYDLAVINPMAVVGPRASRGEVHPTLTGSGAFRIAAYEPMQRFRFARWDGFDAGPPACPEFELRLFVAASARDGVALWALERGRVDAVIEDWIPSIPRAKAVELATKGFSMERARGSAVVLLLVNSERAPFDDNALRRRLAAAIDRRRLVDDVELGLGEPVSGLFAPWIADWPPSSISAEIAAVNGTKRHRAVFMVSEGNVVHVRTALALAEQLRAAAIDVAVEVLPGPELSRRLFARDFDLVLSATWGVPYDPQTTLFARFCPQPPRPTAVETPPFHPSRALERLVSDYVAELEPSARAQIARRIQVELDAEVPLVALYAPDRIAVRRPELEGLGFGEHGYEIDVRSLRISR